MSATTATLESLVRDAGMDWLIDWYHPTEEAVPYLRDLLDRAGDESRRRYGDCCFGFTDEELVSEFSQGRHRVQALFQALGVTSSPQMLVLAWGMTQGVPVESLDLSYLRGNKFRLRVRLCANSAGAPRRIDGQEDVFESDRVGDLRLLRHFGTMYVNDSPLIDGFNALRIDVPQ